MAVMKLSKSGNQIQFVDDFGNVYGTSWQSLVNLKSGKVKQGFTMLMRLPFNVSPLRFGVSPTWNPGNVNVMPLAGSNTNTELNNDILAYETFKTKGSDKDKKIDDIGDW